MAMWRMVGRSVVGVLLNWHESMPPHLERWHNAQRWIFNSLLGSSRTPQPTIGRQYCNNTRLLLSITTRGIGKASHCQSVVTCRCAQQLLFCICEIRVRDLCWNSFQFAPSRTVIFAKTKDPLPHLPVSNNFNYNVISLR